MKINLETIQVLKNDLSDELLNYYSSCDLLAVDCEMMGLNPIRDRLCLVQMCDKNEKITLVKIEPDTKPPNLKKLFENPEIRKIFHFARTDLSFLYYHLQIEMKNVFCTKSASKLARTYTDKHGLKDLLKEILNIDIDKNTQQTDWGHSELTKDQIKYAASDVLYLIPAYHKLLGILKRENRMGLTEEVNKFLPVLAKLDLLGYVDFFVH
ncbi:MAG: ribonuclease D [Candidatus Melainabacteria bacterium RIFCSPLOWO2_12_FULL_35_11]|nr:MAG: ribonuclease D [Candidatus Melainabacteria bacterium RIFCSPLOWO2_12_FULL_35_11]